MRLPTDATKLRCRRVCRDAAAFDLPQPNTGRLVLYSGLAVLTLICQSAFAQEQSRSDSGQPSSAEVRAAMRKAAEFYRGKIARHGGYVYFTSPDFSRRWGEGAATSSQIWVQPPGTPTVGMAYLDAYSATGDEYYRSAATDAALALAYGQLQSGAWTNCVDFDTRGSRVSQYRNGKGKGRNFSSLDDDQSQSAIRFMIRADRAHNFQQPVIHEAAKVALNALLRAQFNNGAFPQGWDETPPPKGQNATLRASFPQYDWRTEGRIKNYWDMYTLNDGMAGTVSKVLIEAHQIYGDKRYREALVRFGEFLVASQLPAPQAAWAQQYSYDMHPIWARKFEPAAVAGRESQDVLETLLTIYQETGDMRFLEPIPKALAYLKRSTLPDGQLARYYELKTNRPLYMQRNGKVYSLTYDDSKLPKHYGWKGESRLDEIEFRYHSVLADRHYASDAPSAQQQAATVRMILADLDSSGRWMSRYQGERLVGQPKFVIGEEYISSQVFSDNLRQLAKFLK